MRATRHSIVMALLLTLTAVLDAQQAIYWKKDYVRDSGGMTIGTVVPAVSGNIAPGHLVATATGTTSAALTWDAPVPQGGPALHHYEVYRRTTGPSYSQVAGNVSTTSYSDTGLSSATAYIYMVRACYTSACSSSADYMDSNDDLATTVVFTDDPLTAGTTTIKAAHISELRTAVDAVRTSAGLGGASWTDTSLSGVVVKAVHISELRSNLDAALSELGIFSPSYTDPTITAQVTAIKKAHIEELRNALR